MVVNTDKEREGRMTFYNTSSYQGLSLSLSLCGARYIHSKRVASARLHNLSIHRICHVHMYFADKYCYVSSFSTPL